MPVCRSHTGRASAGASAIPLKTAVLAQKRAVSTRDMAHAGPNLPALGWVTPAPRGTAGHWRLTEREEVAMLWTIFVILLVLWLLGVVTSYTLGGFIHVLLVIAVIVIVIRLIQGRRPLP